jgi:hypothetical protein
MKTHVARAVAIALMMWAHSSTLAAPQRITSFTGTAKGQGTLIAGRESSKINSVTINLKENGDADITLFTDLQLLATGQWSASDDAAKGIALKITGGVVEGNATGSGTLFLSSDGKSISKLSIQAKGRGSRKVAVQFVADKSQ